MAVLSGATASGRLFYVSGNVPTSATTVYTAPTYSSNVTSTTAGTSTSSSGSATAYIKEISFCNSTSNPATFSVLANGVYIIDAISVNANDSKILSGLNTMLGSGATIQVLASVANTSITISGVEVQ